MKLSATVKEAVADAESEISNEETAHRALALPDLEHAKTAVLNSPTSASGQRTYDRSPLSDPPRAAPIRARDHQSAAGGRPPHRVRGC
jgi:hypothetical protein